MKLVGDVFQTKFVTGFNAGFNEFQRLYNFCGQRHKRILPACVDQSSQQIEHTDTQEGLPASGSALNHAPYVQKLLFKAISRGEQPWKPSHRAVSVAMDGFCLVQQSGVHSSGQAVAPASRLSIAGL